MLILNISTTKFQSDGNKYQKVLQESELEWIQLFKERHGFAEAFKILVQISKEGISLIAKDTFPSTKRKTTALHEKIAQIGDLIIDAIEKVLSNIIYSKFIYSNSRYHGRNYLLVRKTWF